MTTQHTPTQTSPLTFMAHMPHHPARFKITFYAGEVDTQEERKEQAAYIVKAVKLHDELVASLETIVEALKPEIHDHPAFMRCAYDEVCAVLAKARAS